MLEYERDLKKEDKKMVIIELIIAIILAIMILIIYFYQSNFMNKLKISITLDRETIKWINSQIKIKRFASLSHAIDYSLNELRINDKTKNYKQEKHL